jgi:hypothetical protein
MGKDYYKILGVKKDASQDEIKKAYRKLALKWSVTRSLRSADATLFHSTVIFSTSGILIDVPLRKKMRHRRSFKRLEQLLRFYQIPRRNVFTIKSARKA